MSYPEVLSSTALVVTLVDPVIVVGLGFHTALLCAMWLLFMRVAYPLLVRVTWRRLLCPSIAKRFPRFAQEHNLTRPSYFPTGESDEFALSNPLPNMQVLVSVFRYGLLIGLLGALFPTSNIAMLLYIVFMFVEGISVLLMCRRSSGARLIDGFFASLGNIIKYTGSLILMYYVVHSA